jgi:hypothetical protein
VYHVFGWTMRLGIGGETIHRWLVGCRSLIEGCMDRIGIDLGTFDIGSSCTRVVCVLLHR